MKTMKKVVMLIVSIMMLVQCNMLITYAASAVAAPKIKQIEQTDNKQVTLAWGKVSGAFGYSVEYKKGNGEWKTASTKKTYCTINKLTNNKTYSFRVKAYKKVNGKKEFGGYSATKKVKISTMAKPLAASVTKNCRTGQYTQYTLTTGRGLFYALGILQTKLTITNNSNYQVTLYEYVWGTPVNRGFINPRTSKTISVKGNGKNVTFGIYFYRTPMNLTASVKASVNVGSIR